MSRGFVIIAENTATTNYVRCAEALAMSLHRCMPDCAVTLLSDDNPEYKMFDQVIPLGRSKVKRSPTDPFNVASDCMVYELSPYEHTIKLEADMFIPRRIDHWFDVLQSRDITLSTTIRNFKGEISDCRVYRKFIDDNGLPDVYNAITYFRKSDTAEKFFQVVRHVVEHWNEYKKELKCNPQEEVSTDWAYAIASHIIGPEKTTTPGFTEMSMTHMKQYVNGLPGEDWSNTLVYECLDDVLRIHTYVQEYPLHYHIKTFSDILIERYK